MKAETVFNVFNELSDEEKKRFFKMCGVEVPELKPKRKKKPQVMGDAAATEYLIKAITKKGKR